jgi:hypothetical protein
MRFLTGGRFWTGGMLALLIPAGCLVLGQSESIGAGNPPPDERLVLGVEWRLIRGGIVTIDNWPFQTSIHLESAGIVSSLMRIHDDYSVHYEDSLCATSSQMETMEGKRHHQLEVNYDRGHNHASFVERDLDTNKVLKEAGTDTANCVADVAGAFAKLRTMNLGVGQSTQIPVSDGRKFAAVKVTAQERETVKTPLGAFKAVRYQADLMNGVVYPRKGEVWLWLTDDARKLPVQIRLRTSFPIGTVTLALEKEEHK